MVNIKEHHFGSVAVKGDIRLVGVEKVDYNFKDKVKHKLFWNYTDKKYFILKEYDSGLCYPLNLDFNDRFARVQYNCDMFNPKYFPHENKEIARHWTDNDKIKLFYNFSGYLFVEMLWNEKKVRKVYFDFVDYKVDPYESYVNKCLSQRYLESFIEEDEEEYF